MNVDLQLPVGSRRFEWIMQGASQGPDKVFDEDLARYKDAAVIPTRGALVAEWLLVVPRRPYLSIAQCSEAARKRLLAIADTVSARVAAQTGAAVIFEHGPGSFGTATGCGVDQAHLHVVGGAYDFLPCLVELVNEIEWSPVDYSDPWDSMSFGSDYLMIRNGTNAVRAFPNAPVSQRLRRAMAKLLAREAEWNYRSHPQTVNALRTKEIFRGAFHGDDA